MDNGEKGYLLRVDLLKIPELSVNPLAERIVDLFIPPQNKDQKCDFSRFCAILAHFQPTKSDTKDAHLNSAKSKAKLIFEIFDKDYSGKIAQDEILEILRFMVNIRCWIKVFPHDMFLFLVLTNSGAEKGRCACKLKQ